MVTQGWKNTGKRIAVSAICGNLGVASAALLTGFFIDSSGWRWAFIVPGVFSIAIGLMYVGLIYLDKEKPTARSEQTTSCEFHTVHAVGGPEAIESSSVARAVPPTVPIGLSAASQSGVRSQIGEDDLRSLVNQEIDKHLSQRW